MTTWSVDINVMRTGERPPHVDITWVVDGNERVFFRAQFVGWEVDDAQRAPAADHMNVTQRATYVVCCVCGRGSVCMY